jgi:hypothetical protein
LNIKHPCPMQTSNYFNSKVKENFDKFFDKTVINHIGRISDFIRRKPQKITAFNFIIGFIEGYGKRCYTYSQWAAAIGGISGKPVSKQALFERINNASAVNFAKALCMHAIGKKITQITRSGLLFTTFKRVLLQDSTTLALAQNLRHIYPGNVSHGEQNAVARLQCLINIKTMQWLDIALKPFTSNDQSASKAVLPILQKGDLLIRDLGYFILGVFEQIEKQQAFYISRLRYGINLYDNKGDLINWKQLCKRKKNIDQRILIGAEQKLSVRIVMIPLPPARAAERIRKAKTHRDRRLNHSDDYYRWLHYNVFITNVADATLTAVQIAEAYKVRWQIEILFKSWKSGLHLQKMLHEKCTNIHRVETCIYLMLMLCCLVIQQVYMPYNKKIYEKTGKYLSLLKVCSYAYDSLLLLIQLPCKILQHMLTIHCCYETRNDRINMTELIRKT